MNYKKAILILLCNAAFAPLAAASGTAQTNTSNTDMQSQIAALDNQIQQLKNARDVAAMRAYTAGNTADQVMDRDWLGYKTALDQQTQFQEQVTKLDGQIAELEKQKAALQAKIKK